MLGRHFKIWRIAFLGCVLLFWAPVGIFPAATAHAFWPNLFGMGEKQGNILPGSVPATDLAATGAAITEAKKLAAEGNYDEAINRYTDAINRSPRDAVLYFERGGLYYYRRMRGPSDKEKALVPPSDGSAESPPDPKSSMDMEPVAGASEPCELALSDFNQAIALNPNYDIFFFMRGVVLSAETCSQGNMEKAIEDYDQALKLSPSNGAYYQERSNAQSKLKHYELAINDIDQAIRIEPNNYYLYYEKGRIQEQMGLTRDATVSYRRALEMAPPDQMAPFILALKEVRKNSSGVLVADYTDLITKRPFVSLFYIHRGQLYGDERKFKKAIADFSTALSFQNDNRDLYFTRGKLFCEADGKAEAWKDFQASCRLNHPAACYYERILKKDIDRGDRWVSFWYSRDHRQYFYDRKNMKAQERNRKVIRVRIEPDDSVEENPVMSEKVLTGKDQGVYSFEWWEFNCPNSQFRISARKRFDRNSQVMVSSPDSGKTFRPVFPGGISEKLSKIVCGQSNERGAPRKRVHASQDKPIYSP
jgi:tetratricopeptide (TPR) repeat protein